MHRTQAQGEAILRKALQELKLWGLQRQFSFVEPGTDKNDTTNTQVYPGSKACMAAVSISW